MTTARIIIRNDIQELDRIREFIERHGDEWGFSTKNVFSINLVLEELITNIIFYGFDNDQVHDILIDMQLRDDQLQLLIEDDGKPFDPFSVDTPEDLDKSLEERRIGGLGIHFVREIMDTCSYERTGNKNRLLLSKHVK
ncbi:MAG TPA: ATP-binding protein [Bacteroidales bacterium]|nr:ATP-binding protein [Bacteroidales bacterium]HRZ22395.1 ATP-binding protein [Bacteroidales bacterium]